MPCALRKLDWVELLVLIELSRLYAKKLREFKVELKLEKLCDADGGVVCTHGEVGCGESGRWLGAREKWFHFFFQKSELAKKPCRDGTDQADGPNGDRHARASHHLVQGV